MAVSVRMALKNVASENYDKKNIFVYFILLFISGICSGFFPQKADEITTKSISAIILYLILFLPLLGIYVIATNNAIRKRKGVFPNLIKDFGAIIKNSLIYFFGSFLAILLPSIVCGFLFGITIAINPILAIIVIPIIIAIIIVYIGLYFNYVTNLKFGEWFNYKKAITFLKKTKGHFAHYIVRVIALQLISGSIATTIVMIAVVFLTIFTLLAGKGALDTAQMAMTFISSLISAIIFGISALYIIDLTGQFVREVLTKPKQKQIETQ